MDFDIEFVDSIKKIGREDWASVAPFNHPFLSYDFLLGLEESASVGTKESGWVPHFLIAKEKKRLKAAIPFYLKYDSYGEYIFDWEWARAAQMNGIPYYPKLLSGIPFSPVRATKLLFNEDKPTQGLKDAIFKYLSEEMFSGRISGIHFLFEDENEQEILEKAGYSSRLTHQYHWRNFKEWTNFDDFLSSMNARSRKMVKKERARANSHKLKIEILSGEKIKENHWERVYRLYQNTTYQKFANQYLTREFFDYLYNHMRENIIIFAALDDEEILAASLCLFSGDVLFGRYWGAVQEIDCLHFELCYYKPVEWCLDNKIKLFEAGAQGEHKIKRGFVPSRCFSSHKILHPGLAKAIDDFLKEEANMTEQVIFQLKKYTPFKEELKEELRAIIF